MSDQTAFLHAIRAAPGDDTPRLAFADWLDEHDQPARAEFVRVQVELEPVSDRLEVPRVTELRGREAELLAEHRAAWLGAAASLEPAPVFRRGFPEVVCLRLDTFLSRGPALFAEHPTLREVAVFDSAGRVEKLAGHPALAHVETLEIAEPIYRETPADSERLVAALRNADVSRLRVAGVWTSYLGRLVNLLAQGPAAATPHRLELVYHRDLPNAVPPEQVARLRGVSASVRSPFAGPFPIAGGEPEDVVGFVNIRRPVLKRQLLAGHAAGRPAVVGVKFTTGEHDFLDYALVHVVTFDADGRQVGEESHVVSAFAEHTFEGCDRDLSQNVVRKLRDGLGFVPGVVRVRPFESAEGMSVSLWPGRLWQYLDVEASGPPDGVSYSEWRNRGGEVWRWLHDRKFVVRWDEKTFVFDDAGRPI